MSSNYLGSPGSPAFEPSRFARSKSAMKAASPQSKMASSALKVVRHPKVDPEAVKRLPPLPVVQAIQPAHGIVPAFRQIPVRTAAEILVTNLCCAAGCRQKTLT